MNPAAGLPAVSVHVVSLPWRRAVRGLTQVAADRRFLAGLDGVAFALAGRSSGGGGTRDVRASVTPRRQLVLVEWDSPDAAAAGVASLRRRWADRGADVWSASLDPLRSRGTWRSATPFQPNGPAPPETGLVAVLTCARVRPAKMPHFYVGNFPRTARAVRRADSGMLAGIGFGEVPIRTACTMSFWRSEADVGRFAYGRTGPHGDVQRRSVEEGWQSESLFARFAVVTHHGSWAGSDPLAA